MTKGRITIPTDETFVEGTKRIAELWGADAVRDCDGTVLPKNAREIANKVYNTYFVIRGDEEWGENNPDEWQHLYLMTPFTTAEGHSLKINLMKGYYPEQVAPDFKSDPNKYWEVIDRTTGRMLGGNEWSIDEKDCAVTIKTDPFHEYTVSFLAISLWDPVHMYNYITNGWDCAKHRMYDPFYPKTKEYIKRHMKKWCEEHPETNVVRFTTFLYQFSLVFNEKGKEKNVNWFGYSMAVSPKMIDAFEEEYGYKLRAEYLVNAGQYDSTFRIPSKEYRDYCGFVEKFVSKTAKELVDIVHENNKDAMMFLGDCWIGTEPYGEHFKSIGLDAVVGSVGGGVTVRMLSDMPGVAYTEGRFLPYFFPDTFFEGNENATVDELNRNWRTARRAMLRNPIDRIGFGGYLSLADKFPKFINRAAEICEEFRTIYDNAKNKSPKNFLTVGVLSAWGEKRSWMCHMVAHELWYQQCYSYAGVLESLSGLPVDVKFISFDDIKNGALKNIDVVINAGMADTSWSGGQYWKDERIITEVRKFIYEGGGFIGIGEPTATHHSGKLFQLSDALGVERECGFTLSEDKYNIQKKDGHFIFGNAEDKMDYGEGVKNIYALEGTEVLDIEFSDRFKRAVNVGEVKAAVKSFGKGRCFYAVGLPYNPQNSRLLFRAMLWCAHKEGELQKALSQNILTECAYYEKGKKYAVINNSDTEQTTDFYDINGKKETLKLKAGEIRWISR